MIVRLLAFVLLITLLTQVASALEIDEKLTLRILKISSTKKTVLVNRGLEDGLVVGDHAKFFLTTGVVARGEVVKASPSRSIWAIYRLVDPDRIKNDIVMNLKISTPVKVTDDPTKSLAHERTGKGSDKINIPLADGAQDLPGEINEEDQKDLATLEGDASPRVMYPSGKYIGKMFEVWGLIHFNGLSVTSDLGTGGTNTGKNSSMDFSLGGELYFEKVATWYHNITLSAHIHSGSDDSMSLEGDQVKSTVFEYGFGANYHFLGDPFALYRPILFAGANVAFGSTKDSVSINRTTTFTTSSSFNGSCTSYSLGVGAKYFTAQGLGMRAILDYYSRSESYSIDDGGSYSKVVTGPRIMAGVSYRF